MQGRHLFEYAVIRVVPRVEREEFLNVGVILFCNAERFLQSRYSINKTRIKHFSEDADLNELEIRLQAFTRICAGKKEGGIIGQFPIAERFRWLTANRSTIVQCSAVHPGFCINPQETLEKLYEKLVL